MEQNLQKLRELTDLFKLNIKQYKKNTYDEANTRVDFIDKYFELLDWDVRNEQGFSEDFREVVREDTVYIAGKPKAPDYSFRIGGKRIFFVEAKKPTIDIKEGIEPAFQLRRYSYTAKLSLSVLTDFEEFAIYDTRIKPIKNDKASRARIFYCNFEEYEKNFEYIYNIFSKTSVLKGSFDRYVEENKNKKGTSGVDKEFLQLIESWRNELARNIALRNKELDIYNLNYAVQKIIDRLIFLRIAEDRHTEKYGTLLNIVEQKSIYNQLNKYMERADAKYNSSLFKVEGWLNSISIDDKVLFPIIKGMYYPDCPYEFSVLPIEILGNIYEQFLGKTIRLTTSHQAKIEEKPQVRKAGGVYYTPQYIVDYIVKNTVGEKIKDKKPVQIEKIKILDPACGSGSFLVGAFNYLLDYHLQYYRNEKNIKKALREGKVYQISENTYRLSIQEKQKILLSNIFGVDIDSQAGEVTKLSLLLKLMENESVESEGDLFKHSDFKFLPDLSSNIKCGNSLIGSDYYNDKNLSLFGNEVMRKINVFDWEKEFANIFTNGGFDVVIGNPPYIRIQILKDISPESVNYIKDNYYSSSKGNTDIYITFIEKGLNLLNNSGVLSYILPNKFLTTDYGLEIREIISSKQLLEKIIDFRHAQVFENATTYTCLLFLNKDKPKLIKHKKVVPNIDNLKNLISFNEFTVDYITKDIWVFRNELEETIYKKLSLRTINLLDIPTNISRGSSSGNDNIFMLNELEEKKEFTDINGNIITIENEIIRRPLFATDFSRYNFNPKSKKVIIFPYKKMNDDIVLISENEFKSNYPNAYTYLCKNKKELLKRKQYKSWYGFSAPRNLKLHNNADIVIPLLANKGLFTLLLKDNNEYCLMASGGFSISINNDKYSPNYILALINSKLLFWFLKSISNEFRSGWITCTKQYMSKLPIKLCNTQQDIEIKEKLEKNVAELINLYKEYTKSITHNDKKKYQQKIELIDNQIDQMVYNLYGLTEEDIKIIESNV